MDELAELEQLELDEQLQSAPTSVVEPSRTEVPNTVFSLPVAPSGPIQVHSSNNCRFSLTSVYISDEFVGDGRRAATA